MNHNEFLKKLESGQLRSAEINENNNWKVNIAVKQQILDIFGSSKIIDMENNFRDKENLKIRNFSGDKNGIRIVPGGTSIRAGTYIGNKVVIMPPSYVNIGAYVDDESMIDSHVLVGSCAQIGKRVHLSAGVQIGGVLEPIGQQPTIIEDDCFIGAGAILTEGILLRKNTIIAPGVILSASIPIYDIVNETIYKCEIPSNAIVVSGTRPIGNNRTWAQQIGINVSCALIIKYRDEKTEKSIELEKILR